jgi:hypothetical protein
MTPQKTLAADAVHGVWVLVCFALLFVLGVWAHGCAAPKAGQRCEKGEAYCAGPSGCLSCKDGLLAAYQCTGPKGCYRDEERSIFCDQASLANPGEVCLPIFEGLGQCSRDGKSTIQCLSGVWAVTACPHGHHCADNMSSVRCVPIPTGGLEPLMRGPRP